VPIYSPLLILIYLYHIVSPKSLLAEVYCTVYICQLPVAFGTLTAFRPRVCIVAVWLQGHLMAVKQSNNPDALSNSVTTTTGEKVWTPCNNVLEMCGPYNTYENCISAMYTAAKLQASVCHNGKDLTTEADSSLSNFKRTLTTSKGHKPTLTHLDLSLQNIIVRLIQGI
jgi:hypothetical protein